MPVANGQKVDIPSVGFGTWFSDEKQSAEECILTALQSGYRHLDSAWGYNSSKPVGNAIRAPGIPREEIHVTSKVWLQFLAPENVELALDKVLQDSGMEYVDLFLAHHTVVFKNKGREALEKAEPSMYDQGGMGVLLDEKGLPVPD